MFYYVYRVDDPATGEYYFGSRSCECLPSEDFYTGSMVKWKPENKKRLIKTIIKEDFISRKDAYMFEREIILNHFYDSMNRNYAIPSERFFYYACGEKNHFYGKKHTEESRNKMSNVDRSGKKNSMWGKHFSKESKEKMRERKKNLYDGAKNPRARKLYQYDSYGNLIKIWDCAVDCVCHHEKEGIKLSRGNISGTSKHNSDEKNSLRRLSNFIFSFVEINKERFKKFTHDEV
jgi:hypothetical protein